MSLRAFVVLCVLSVSLSAVAAERGEVLYQAHCQLCHQPDGTGMKGKLAADFVNDTQRMRRPDEQLLKSINDGLTGPIGTMPSWSGLLRAEDQLSVLHYIRKTFDKSAK